MDVEDSSKQSLIEEALDKLRELRDYKSSILDSVEGNTLTNHYQTITDFLKSLKQICMIVLF